MCLFLFSGCDSSPSTSSLKESDTFTVSKETDDDSAPDSPYHVSIPETSIDAKFLRIEEDVPGFAGLYNAGDGEVRAFVQDEYMESTSPLVLRAAIESVFDNLSKVATVRGSEQHDAFLVIEAVPYTFSDLSDIRIEMLDAFQIDGVHTVDVDEKNNRVRVLADGPTAVLDAQQFAQDRGIPFAAIDLVDAPPAAQMAATLRDRIRPLTGGLQIAFDSNLCTLGFIAERKGIRGFVTNAHCSSSMFTVTPTYFYQPSRTQGNYIGYEYADPALYADSYRYSDAAFVRITSSVSSSLGRIARTSGWAFQTGSGSLTIDGELEIDREDCNVTTSDYIDKIGRTTGWTFGVVESTCQTVNMGSYTLYCQDEVRAGVDGGDSGSATFRWKGDTDNNGIENVDLTGLLWGGRTYPSGKKTFLYSPMCQVETDIGSLQTY